jgi:serine/threonine protein phosphatase 1
VLEQVVALAERCVGVPVRGNHEGMVLAALAGQSELRYYLRFGGTEALASYGHRGGPELRPADLWALIPVEHLRFIGGCRDYFETVRHIFVHACYEPDRPLREQQWGGLRWASLPPVPKPHCSGKVAVVGHRPQTSGEVLDLGYLKCIDTFCNGGGWLTALEVGTRKVQRDTWFMLRMTGRAVGNGFCDEKSRCFVNSQECTSFNPSGRRKSGKVPKVFHAASAYPAAG